MQTSDYAGIDRAGSSGNHSYSVKGGLGDRAVNWASFYDSLRFAIWLYNGQGGGDTESGAYTLVGANPQGVTRNREAKLFLLSEYKWYKAA